MSQQKVEEPDPELLTNYAEMLQAMAMPILLKKARKKNREDSQFKRVVKQIQLRQAELFAIEKRILAIQNLSKLSAKVDDETARLNHFFEMITNSEMLKVVSKLIKRLQPFTTLKLTNIKMPSTEEDVNDFLNLIENIARNLENFNLNETSNLADKIKVNSEAFGKIAVMFSEFVAELHKTIKELQFVIIKATVQSLDSD